MYGKLPFDKVAEKGSLSKDSYPDEIYRDLCKNLTDLRQEHTQVSIVGPKRKKLAKQELDAWLGFIEKRKLMLKDNPDFTIDADTMMKLRDNYERFRDRKSARVPSEKITELHEQFAGNFRFRVPIHPKNLAQLINPYQGYMANFKPDTKFFSWTQMQQVYDINIIASFEKTQGRYLLGDELACLSMWLLQDEKLKGFLEIPELLDLMHAFRFTNITNQEEFLKEFEFELNQEFMYSP